MKLHNFSAVTVTKFENAVFCQKWRTETEVFWSQVKTVLPSDVCIYVMSNSMNRRTDRRTNTHGNNVHRDRRRHALSTSDIAATFGLCRAKRTDERESNLVDFSFKMWHLVAKMLTNFLMINWPHFVYLVVDPGFCPPNFLWSIAVCSPLRMDAHLQTQRTKRQTNERKKRRVSSFIRPSLRWSLTHTV